MAPRVALPREGATFVFWKNGGYSADPQVSSSAIRELSHALNEDFHVCGLCPSRSVRVWCGGCGEGGVYVANHLLPALIMRDAQQGDDDDFPDD